MTTNKETTGQGNWMKSYQEAWENLAKTTAGTFKEVSNLQSQFFQETLNHTGNATRQWMAAPADQKAQVAQEAMSQAFGRVVSHGQALAQTFSKKGDQGQQAL